MINKIIHLLDDIRIRIVHNENILWFLIGILITGKFIVFSFFGKENIWKYFEIFYLEISIGIIFAIFPFVFFQVFGKYPLQALRERKNDPSIIVNGNNNVIAIANQKNDAYHEITSGIGILTQLVINAESLSNKIYRRSGIYLIFGVLIAFSGILYFSLQNAVLQEEKELSRILLSLLPRFGILFFIELIAFFFLKQYRSAMDEFKHYDEIKRNRESQLTLYIMAIKDFEEKDFSNIADKMNFFAKIGILSSGETTQIIESSKLHDNELNDIMKHLTELIKVSKIK